MPSQPRSNVDRPRPQIPHLSSDSRPPTPSLLPLKVDFTPPTSPLPLDFTLPMSDLLREGTKRAHVTAEHSDGAKALATGQLELTEYIRYLTILWMVYIVLETELEEQKDHPALRTTYKPRLLARSTALAADIEYLSLRCQKTNRVVETKEEKSFHPSFKHAGLMHVPFAVPSFLRSLFLSPPKEVTNYQFRIKEISSTSPELLLSHTYVRYLGDLSGGQLVGSRMRKRYDLRDGKKGTEFYEFEEEGDEAIAETRLDRKRHVQEIKDWFRTGVDLAVGDDQLLKARLVDEAIKSFEMATRLFFLLKPSDQLSDNGFIATSTVSSSSVPASIPPVDLTPGSPIWVILALLLAIVIANLGFVISGTSTVEMIKLVGQKFSTVVGK